MNATTTKRAITLALAVAFTGACESSTGPEDMGAFDALAALADHEAMDATLDSDAMSRFQALSSGVTFQDAAPEFEIALRAGADLMVPGTETEARALTQRLLDASASMEPRAANAPIISGFRRGKTFVYDPDRGRYVLDEDLTGAPSTGVRFILYARGGDGKPDPTQEVGYADLIDEDDSSPEAIALRLVVVEGTDTIIEYRTTLDHNGNSGAITVAGFLQGEDNRLDFDIQVEGSRYGGTNKVDVTFEFGIAAREFKVIGAVTGMESDSGDGGEIDIQAKHGSDSFRADLTGSETSLEGTFYLNGDVFATVTGDPDDPTFEGATGEPLTWAEALVIHQIVDSSEDAWDFFEDLLDPVDELVLLAIIL